MPPRAGAPTSACTASERVPVTAEAPGQEAARQASLFYTQEICLQRKSCPPIALQHQCKGRAPLPWLIKVAFLANEILGLWWASCSSAESGA